MRPGLPETHLGSRLSRRMRFEARHGGSPLKRPSAWGPAVPPGFPFCLVLGLVLLGPAGAPAVSSALLGQEAKLPIWASPLPGWTAAPPDSDSGFPVREGEPAARSWTPRIRIVPRVGLLSPDTYFYEEFKNFSGDGFVEWTTGSLGRAALLGLGVEVGLEGLGVNLRGEISRSFEGWLAAAHGVLIPRVFFQPPEVVTTWFDLPASVTFLSLHAILPTRFTFHGLQPFVLAGYSGKWYSFGPPTRENTVEAIFPSNGWTASVDLGGGVTLELLGVALEAQVRDNINRYWDKTQHDLVFSGGVVWTVR